MTNADYHIIGVGLNINDLRYIGWTRKPLEEQRSQVLSELIDKEGNRLSDLHNGENLSVFEIETVISEDIAQDSIQFWCQYYRSIGLEVASVFCYCCRQE